MRSFARLNSVSVHDGGNQARKAFVDLSTAGRVVHFHAEAFPSDQAGFAQSLKMLRKRRFGNGLLTDIEEIGPTVGTTGCGDYNKARYPHGVGQGMQNCFDRYVFDRGME